MACFWQSFLKQKNSLMQKVFKLIMALLILSALNSCSKKIHSSKTPEVIVTADTTSSVIAEKPMVIKRKPKTVFPKTISVNDSAAHKSIDGRLYYDVLGHRYWKNYKDGKYYLFNKTMYNNPAFKPNE